MNSINAIHADSLATDRDYSLLITDARRDDNPIVYASDNFLRLTGYGLDEVMGRNCRFLQGPETDPDAIRSLREAIKQGEGIELEILNYRKDKRLFRNLLRLRPMFDEDGLLTNYLGMQRLIGYA